MTLSYWLQGSPLKSGLFQAWGGELEWLNRLSDKFKLYQEVWKNSRHAPLPQPLIQRRTSRRRTWTQPSLPLYQQKSIISWKWSCPGKTFCPGSVSSIRVFTSNYQSSSRFLVVCTVIACRKKCVDSNLLALWPCTSIPIFLCDMNRHAVKADSICILLSSINPHTVEWLKWEIWASVAVSKNTIQSYSPAWERRRETFSSRSYKSYRATEWMESGSGVQRNKMLFLIVSWRFCSKAQKESCGKVAHCWISCRSEHFSLSASLCGCPVSVNGKCPVFM